MSHTLDALDRKILQTLQADCRQSVADMADQVGLSKSACHRRVKLLEEQGIIDRYTAVLSPSSLGYSLTFVVDITLRAQSDDVMTAFENSVRRLPQVLECQLMTGRNDYILRVVAQSAEDY
ncbi:MAG: Lrp/AsnC family transcriptional regulator, partial [Pseudomonadota bacterium]